MAKYEITAEMNLKKIIAESREVAQALKEFADNLERIEKKYAEPQESEKKREMNPNEEILIEIIKVSNKEMSALFLQYYIQRHGPLSNEAGDIVKKLLEEKE